MAYVVSSKSIYPHDEARQYLMTGEVPLSAAASSGAAVTGAAPATGSVSTPSPTPAPTSSEISPSLRYDPSQGSVLGGLLSPAQKRAETEQGRIQQIGEQFRTLAGPSRTWEGIGGQQTLQQAIVPGTQQPQAWEEARQLVNAQYQGPTGLDATESARIGNSLAELGAYTAALRHGSGLQAVLQGGVPGLTSGMAREEAQKLAGNEEYRRSVMPEQTGLSAARAAYGQETEGAQRFAEQRKQEEEQIRDTSRDWLKTEQEQILGGIQSRADALNATNEAIRKLYSQATETGVLPLEGGTYQKEGTRATGAEQRTPTAVSPRMAYGQFSTPYDTQLAEARRAWDEIMAQYPSLAQFAPLNLTVVPERGGYYTGPGGEFGGEPLDLYQVFDPATGRQRPISQEEIAGLIERQQALEQVFRPYSPAETEGPSKFTDEGKVEPGLNRYSMFDPITGEPYWSRGGEPAPGMVLPPTEGQYANVMPLYFGEPYERQGVGAFLDYDPGRDATIQGEATEGERFSVEQIAGLLDQVNQLSAQGQSFEAASLAADVMGYLKAETERMKAREQTLDEASKAWNYAAIQELLRWQKAGKQNPDWGRIAEVMQAA